MRARTSNNTSINSMSKIRSFKNKTNFILNDLEAYNSLSYYRLCLYPNISAAYKPLNKKKPPYLIRGHL